MLFASSLGFSLRFHPPRRHAVEEDLFGIVGHAGEDRGGRHRLRRLGRPVNGGGKDSCPLNLVEALTVIPSFMWKS